MEQGNFTHGIDSAGRIQIDEIVYETILTCMGYPIIKPTDIKGLTDDDVKRLYIREAMEDFWTKFPMEISQELQVSGQFEVPFPDDATFGVAQSRINNNIHDGTRMASPFYNAMAVTNRMLSSNAFGTGFDYGLRSTIPGKMSEIAGQAQFLKSQKIYVENRTVKGYTNIGGKLLIVWAKKSYNWNDIPFNFQNDVERLAQSKILRGLGMLKKQVAGTDMPVDLDADAFLDRAQELEEQVYERWNNITKVVILR